MLKRYGVCVIFLLFQWVYVSSGFADSISLEAIDGELKSKVIPVLVESNDAEIKKLIHHALGSMHGGYRVVRTPREADFTFEFVLTGGTTVELIIKSGLPAKVLFSDALSAANKINAALRACDLAVSKTLAIPGFFAGQLAFTRGDGKREVWTSDFFFFRAKQITQDGAHSLKPRFSPGGTKLLYTSYYRSGFPDIFLIDLKAQKRSVFASFKGTNMSPIYSPDGRRVACALSNSGNHELYVASSEGTDFKRLTRHRAVDTSPSWSPDGQRLIFESDRMGGPQLFVISASGGQPKRVPTKISGYCAEPDWNPRDVNLVAFTAAMGRTFQIALYDFQKNESTFITQGNFDNLEPCWTNDGRHLIYTKRTKSDSVLMLLDTVSKKSHPLHKPQFGEVSQADFVYP